MAEQSMASNVNKAGLSPVEKEPMWTVQTTGSFPGDGVDKLQQAQNTMTWNSATGANSGNG